MWRLLLPVLAANILSAVPTLAAEAFVGRWAISATVCNGYGSTAATAPLVASDKSVSWYGDSCRVHKMYKLGQVIYLQALCADGKNIPITFDARGDRMKVTWASAKPEELRRCR